MSVPQAAPVVLLVVPEGHELEAQLGRQSGTLLWSRTAAAAHGLAREGRPDVVIVAGDLADATATDLCRALHEDPRVGRAIPKLIATRRAPTAEQRVAALSAGAWDFLRLPLGDVELESRIEAYRQARHSLELALSERGTEPRSPVLNRQGFARRARELGALLTRTHGALACLVISLAPELAEPSVPHLVAAAVRLSDVVAALEPATIGVLAPGAAHAGAVSLARRLLHVLRSRLGVAPYEPLTGVRLGYEAVANLKYLPLDPVELLTRAAAAVRDGEPEPNEPRLRRSSGGTPSPVAATRVPGAP